MKIVITGHRGYLGSLVFSRMSENTAHDIQGIDLVDGYDIANVRDLDADLLIHMAAFTSTVKSINDPDGYVNNNISAYHKFLFSNNNKFKKIIHISSQGIYDDNAKKAPPSLYGITKYASEFTTRNYGGDYINLRLCNPIGYYPKVHHWTNVLTREDPNLLVMMAKMIHNGDIFSYHDLNGMFRNFFPAHWVADAVHTLASIDTRGWSNDVGNRDLVLGSLRDTLVFDLVQIAENEGLTVAYVANPPGNTLGTPIEKCIRDDHKLWRNNIPGYEEWNDNFESWVANQLSDLGAEIHRKNTPILEAI